jgi:hypothetical protein
MYNTPGGELYELKRAFKAASIFDPRVLKSSTKSFAEILCDDLKRFGFK